MNPTQIEMIPIQEWLKFSRIKFFKRHPEAQFVTGYLQISNPLIVKLLESGFEVVTRSTYYINIIARRMLTDLVTMKIYSEEEIFEVEEAIHASIMEVHQYFDVRIAQAEKKINAAGFDVNGIQRLCKNYETQTVTNTVAQYLEVLSKADYYLSLLGYLWITGELSDSPSEAMRIKLTAEHDTRVHLFNLVRFTNKCEARLRSLVDRTRNETHQKREEAMKKKQIQKQQKKKEKQNLKTSQREMDELAQS